MYLVSDNLETVPLNMNVPALYLCSAAGKRVSTGCIQLQGAIGGKREGFRWNQANFNF